MTRIMRPPNAERRRVWTGVEGVSYLWFAVVGVWALVQIVPVLVIFYSSFRGSNAIIGNPFGFGDFDSTNYPTAWHGPEAQSGSITFLQNSVTITGIAIVLAVVCGALSAYGISQSRRKLWARGLFALYLLTVAMPYEIIVLPLFILMNNLVLLDSEVGAGLAYSALVIPTIAILMKGFFDTFPADLVDAARIDGAGELRIFFQIVLPLVKGGLIAAGIIGVVYVWGDVELALIILTSPDKIPISVGMLGFAQQYATNYGALFAGITMALLPIILLYLVFQRYVTRTLTLGSVASK